ncbi:MAG: ROK family protein [Opitutaceae bacterium]
MPPVTPRNRPPLDPGFQPASLWLRAYSALVETDPASRPFALVIERPDGGVARHDGRLLGPKHPSAGLTRVRVERLLKFLLWQKGGCRVRVAGAPELTGYLAAAYGPGGARAFDAEFMGRRVYRAPFAVEPAELEDLPQERVPERRLGGHLDGCRVGFDLGGSERKCAAVIDGRVVHTEAVPWAPYFQCDPGYHLAEIDHSIRRAAARLPRVDAIGGSAAGIYVDNEVRAASLFRGVSDADFETRVRRLFFTLKERWGGVPFEVMNDGEVTALAGAMSLGGGPVFGLSLGTSLGGGYVTAGGGVTPWLNEMAFTPIDYAPDAPVDEWSGDRGCGVQYLSQQGAVRLAGRAGFSFPPEATAAERLAEVREAADRDDPRAGRVYDSLGCCLGYALAHYADFYELRDVLILGGVTSGPGGERLLRAAERVLADEFPALAARVRLRMPAVTERRHHQAVAAASLPESTLVPSA